MTNINRSWKPATTLGQLIVRLVQSGQVGSDEFKKLEAYYGKEKLKELYKKEIQSCKKTKSP